MECVLGYIQTCYVGNFLFPQSRRDLSPRKLKIKVNNSFRILTFAFNTYYDQLFCICSGVSDILQVKSLIYLKL